MVWTQKLSFTSGFLLYELKFRVYLREVVGSKTFLIFLSASSDFLCWVLVFLEVGFWVVLWKALSVLGRS